MKKNLILMIVFILCTNLLKAESVEFWYLKEGVVQYVDYNIVQYTTYGVTHEYFILDIPVEEEAVNTTYWFNNDGTWNLVAEGGWLSQFTAYNWSSAYGYNNNCFILSYTNYNELEYKMCIEVVPDVSTIDELLFTYGLSARDTITVQVYDTVWSYETIYDTVWSYETIYDTVWSYETIYDTIYDTVWSYETIYDTVWSYETIYDTVYDTVWTEEITYETIYETIYDTVIYEEFVSTVDTLIIDLEQRITSAITGAIIDDQVKVYPNPATVELYVECDANSHASAIEIYNASGVCILEVKLDGGFGYTDISNLDTGLYIMVILDESAIQMSTKKLLIQ